MQEEMSATERPTGTPNRNDDSHDQIRVCRIVSDYPVGGRSSYGLQPVFYNLSREQARMGYDVHVIARRFDSQPSQEVNQGVSIHRVGNPFTLNAILLLKALTRGRRSIVHTHATAGLFMTAMKGALSAPLVSHVHGTSRSAFMPRVLKFGDLSVGYSPFKVATSYVRERLLWSSADRVATVCESVRRDLITHYSIHTEKIRAVYNGVDPDVFRPIPNASVPGVPGLEGKKVVLYVGHFGLRKGLFYLIEAMSRVNKEIPESVLVCVGGVPGWLAKADYWNLLRSFIRNNDLEGKVFLLDKVPNEQLPVYYSSCSVSVLPSYYEAFPKVVIEAMACARPVIATRDGGPAEAIGEGGDDKGTAGLLVRFGSAEELADAIIRILQDERLGRQMGTRGRERVEMEYTWPKVARRISSIYGELVN